MMRVTLTASTGAKILVWREKDVFHACHADAIERPQVCLAVDLFEVIAELAGLDLEREGGATEAVKLASNAQRQLAETSSDDPRRREDEPKAKPNRCS
jgi:hypothetical protein